MTLLKKQLTIKWLWFSAGILLLFVGISWWIYQKLDQRLKLINNSVLLSYNREKAEGVQLEFDRFFQQFKQASQLIRLASEPRKAALREARLFSPFWDTLYTVQATRDQVPHLLKDTIIDRGNDLYWRRALPLDTTVAGIGLLISYTNLEKLNRHFWEINEHSRAYFSILDEHGRYLLHPDQSLIGQSTKQLPPADTILISEYLELPVRQISRPLPTGTGTWTLVVAVPGITFEEDASSIRDYMLGLGLAAACLLLLLLYLNDRATRRAHHLALTNADREKEHALLMLEGLRQKFDPHFLFNSLGSLQHLVTKNPTLAAEFVDKLSRVYRYVLRGEGRQLATLADELAFAQQYFFLLQIRFGDALIPLQINIEEASSTKKIPLFSLQILLENAVKHNEISLAHPLRIHITALDDKLQVVNNWQPRKTVPSSSGYGLRYLHSIYQYYGGTSFTAEKVLETYQCVLPLL